MSEGATTGPLASLVTRPAIERFDARVDSLADTLRGRRMADAVFYALSAVGDHGIAWHAVAAGRAALGVDSWAAGAELSAALGVEAAVVNGPVKWLFKRPRPTTTDPRPHSLRTPRTSSFPSGHASSGMFSAMLLRRRSRVPAVWFVLGGLIGYSRVHVRIHHPSDVIGGYLVGLGMGWLGERLIQRHSPISKARIR
jgi:undecaprenyl-diphosphatase